MAEERHTAAFVVGMLVGGLAGAAFVLWTTPRSGADLRARVGESAESLLENVRQIGERLGIESGAPNTPTSITATLAPSNSPHYLTPNA